MFLNKVYNVTLNNKLLLKVGFSKSKALEYFQRVMASYDGYRHVASECL